ncbi:Phage integrase family protein [Burkholderia sp. D7]|nr:Phage integrase family protein [Burkholderia sp. D7]
MTDWRSLAKRARPALSFRRWPCRLRLMHRKNMRRLARPITLARWVERTLSELIIESDVFESDERQKLTRTTAHAFRHTFGTLATAAGALADVIQKILGNLSPQTTSIYVQAEKRRMMETVSAALWRQSR